MDLAFFRHIGVWILGYADQLNYFFQASSMKFRMQLLTVLPIRLYCEILFFLKIFIAIFIVLKNV